MKKNLFCIAFISFNLSTIANDKLDLNPNSWIGQEISSVKNDLKSFDKALMFGDELNGIGSGTIVFKESKAVYYIVQEGKGPIVTSTFIVPALNKDEVFVSVTQGCNYEDGIPIIAIVKSLDNQSEKLPIKKAWKYSKLKKEFIAYKGAKKYCENDNYGL